MSAGRTEAYLAAARGALDLAGSPEVRDRWDQDSALAGMTVGGLAAHLVAQVTSVRATLAAPASGAVAGLDEHYGRVPWRGAPLAADANTAIRDSGESAATRGPDAVLAEGSRALASVATVLPDEADDRPMQPPWLGYSLRLEDFLLTRLMEITVHSDDLASSVGLPTPDQPPEVLEPVLALLTRLAVQRHGQAAVLRTLSRSERAPRSVSAF